jgi:predicted DNA-binding transcriptional regulator AlpA
MSMPNTGLDEPTPPRSDLMTIDEVCRYVGGARPPSHATIYRWMKHQGFPAQIKLSHRCARWRRSEVDAWLLSRRAPH